MASFCAYPRRGQVSEPATSKRDFAGSPTCAPSAPGLQGDARLRRRSPVGFCDPRPTEHLRAGTPRATPQEPLEPWGRTRVRAPSALCLSTSRSGLRTRNLETGLRRQPHVRAQRTWAARRCTAEAQKPGGLLRPTADRTPSGGNSKGDPQEPLEPWGRTRVRAPSLSPAYPRRGQVSEPATSKRDFAGSPTCAPSAPGLQGDARLRRRSPVGFCDPRPTEHLRAGTPRATPRSPWSRGGGRGFEPAHLFPGHPTPHPVFPLSTTTTASTSPTPNAATSSSAPASTP